MSKMGAWMLRILTVILVLLLQLLALGHHLWNAPHHSHRIIIHTRWPGSSSINCFLDDHLQFHHKMPEIPPHGGGLSASHQSILTAHSTESSDTIPSHSHLSINPRLTPIPPPRSYHNNGYLIISCNGGLNQMRAAICDMVAVAKLLNLTLIVPDLDKTSFWNDPSDFGDIFDTNHFITSLRDEVRIINEVPAKLQTHVKKGLVLSLPPISWSNESYYLNQILPLVKKHRIIKFNKTDARVANGGGISDDFQKLRCRVNYESLVFTQHIRELGEKLIDQLKSKGPFLVLHLRYEMDMLAFSGCTHGCTKEEEEELTKLRYAYPWWKEKVIDSERKRSDGLCPLTPEETVLVLKAFGYDKDTQIYIAAGEIYGSERRMEGLYAAYPNIVRKEMLLSPDELRHFQNHSSQMAALDYMVAIESDVFVPTYDGNMAKLVEGHRRYLGYRKTILLDRKRIVELFDEYQNGTLQWDAFSSDIQEAHKGKMGAPMKRRVILDKPKEEDYFYANPHECLQLR